MSGAVAILIYLLWAENVAVGFFAIDEMKRAIFETTAHKDDKISWWPDRQSSKKKRLCTAPKVEIESVEGGKERARRGLKRRYRFGSTQ